VPRAPRTKSKSNIYHIIMRGINRQAIFEDIEDREKFIQTLQKYKGICQFKLYAYCLMDNHLHLLLMVDKEPLETVIRRICGSYVLGYNPPFDSKKKKKAPKPALNSQFAGFVICQKNLAQFIYFR